MPSVSKAEADARALIEAGAIKRDASRLADANMAAVRMAERAGAEKPAACGPTRRKKGSR